MLPLFVSIDWYYFCHNFLPRREILPSNFPKQPSSSTATLQTIPYLTISQPATITSINKNNITSQKEVPGEEPIHIKKVSKEGVEEVIELVLVTENKTIKAEHVKMVANTNAGREDVKKNVITNAGSVATVTLEGG